MNTRCKFTCDSITKMKEGAQVKLVPVMAGSEENKSFFKYTPYGVLELGLLSHETAEQFEVGKEYYIDISPAEE